MERGRRAGGQWLKATSPGDPPEGRGGHEMARDPVCGGVILFGGENYWNNGAYGDTWVFQAAP
jgi:hypothetical protein